MMSEATSYRLSDVIEIIGGGTPKKKVSEYWSGDIPWLSVVDFNSDERFVDNTAEKITELGLQESSTKLLEAGQVIISARGTVGCLAQLTVPMAFNQSCYGLSGKSGVLDNDYLYYLMRVKVAELQQKTHGAVFDTITRETFNHIEVKIPALSTQKVIAKVLGSFDYKIKLNHQINQTLEQMAQAIFKSWFVDFEPTRAKIIAKEQGADLATQELAAQAIICGAITLEQLEELEQNLETTLQQAIDEKLSQDTQTPSNAEQLKATAALFPNALVESEFGSVPEGWKVSEIGKEVTVVGGGTPSTKNEEYWEDGDINWTTPRDMSSLTDKILLETGRKITAAGLARISSGLLPVNTVLMSSRAPVGYLAIAKIPIAVNQGYIAMKCEDVLTPEYIVQWAESAMDEIKQRASGTTFAEINRTNFRVIPVLVPSEDILSQFSKTVSTLYEKITENLKETTTLESVRDTLLPKLLSGELDVSALADNSEANA